MTTPRFFKQTDARWADVSWRGMTIRYAGCGPTSVANVVSALKKTVYPNEVWGWICSHGYMAPGQGTYHSGISAALKHYGITKFKQTYSDAEALKSLKKGQWILGVVGPSRWTTGGHYIVLYKLRSNGKISVSDPYSSSDYCQKNGTWKEYARANKNNWICIDPKDYKKSSSSDKKDTTVYSLFVKCARANVRKGRSTKYGVVGKLPRGTKLTLTSYSKGWYKIKAGKYKGYFISEKTLTKHQPHIATYKALVNMNVRSTYSLKGKIVRTVKKGTKVKSASKQGDWIYVPSVKGWMRIKGKKTYMKKV